MTINEPLGLPEGTVRAIITLILVVATLLYMYLGIDMPEWYYGLVILSVGYYFGSRTANTKTK